MSKLLFVSMMFATAISYGRGLNDLSVLLPLPAKQDFSLMLNPASTGEQGMLLSKKTFQRIVQLVPEHDNQKMWSEQLRVIAIRLDPCFIEGTGPLPCSRQIRLIWQPVFFDETGANTRDASIHSFYEFSESEFSEVLKAWSILFQGHDQDALQVHPIIRKQGLNGIYWKSLKSLILRYCGEQNLIRMTAMNVMADEQLWIFSGFDIKNGQAQEMIIPRTNTRTQAITQTSFQFFSFTGGMTPNPPADDEFNVLVEDSHWFKKKFSEDQVRKAMHSALGFENPQVHNTGTLDCASCHLANMAHQWGEKNYPGFNWDIDFKDVKFQSEFNLTNPTKNEIRPNQFRIFGYFGKEPAVAQRVINETAVVAEYLKANGIN